MPRRTTAQGERIVKKGLQGGLIGLFAHAVLLAGAGSAAATDLDSEKAEVLNAISGAIVESLCGEQGPYLTCLRVTSAQCKSELTQVTAICWERLRDQMPDVGEESPESIRLFGQEFGACFKQRLEELGDFPKASARACLGSEWSGAVQAPAGSKE